MPEPTPYQPDTLTANPESTDWYDLRPLQGSVILIANVTGTVTFYIDISNDERTSVTKDYFSSVSYSESVAKVLDVDRLPDFVRVRKTAGTGSVSVSLSKARNNDGKKTRPAAQSEHDI
jgi:hypothetical protein